MKNKWLLLLAAVLLWMGILIYSWSPGYYWPDADGYTSHIAEGRWVAHPPGYPFFVWVGHAWHALGAGAYQAAQFASLSMTVLALIVSYFLARMFCNRTVSACLVATLAFSWLVLLLAQTGTSHSADLLCISLLLFTALRLERDPPDRNSLRPSGNQLAFAAAILATGGFRFTTLLMMGPFFLYTAWLHRKNLTFWLSVALATAGIVAIQLWVIDQYGGYAEYSASSRGMHERNAFSSVLLHGITQTTVLNVFRTMLWFTLGTFPFFVLILQNLPGRAAWDRRAVAFALLTTLGCLAGTGLYLCTHPGYVAAAVPGLFLLAALAVGRRSVSRPAPWIVAAAASCFLFLLMRPIEPPRGFVQAIANGVLFQYSAPASRNAVFLTTARWLIAAGEAEAVPRNRIEDLEREARDRPPKP